jgi:hypothetical protein
VHEETLQGVQESKSLRIQGEKLRRNNAFMRSSEDCKELTEKERAQGSKPLRIEILPRLGRKCVISGGAAVAVRSARGEEIWTVVLTCPGGAQEESTEGGDRQPSDLI